MNLSNTWARIQAIWNYALVENLFGTPVTIGGMFTTLLFIVLGVALTWPVTRWVRRLLALRDIEDPRVHAYAESAARILVLVAFALLGLDTGDIIPLEICLRVIAEAWSNFLAIWGFVLLGDMRGVQVTLGGVVTFSAFAAIGRRLSRVAAKWASQLAEFRQIEDARVRQAIESFASGATLLVCVGVGLDLGELLNIEDFFDKFFGVFKFGFFKIGETEITITTILTAVAIIFGANWLSGFAQGAVRQTMYLRMGDDVDEGTVRVIERLLYYAIMVMGILVGLQTAGIDLSAILATGAAFAVGLSLALQSIAQNFISGLILLLERAIRPNDILELDGQPVRVVSIGVRSTVVRTLDDEDRIVPNSDLVGKVITNYTFTDTNLRIRAMVGVAYESDLKQVEAVLRKAARDTQRLRSGEPVVLLVGFGASSVDFEVSVWIDDPWRLRRAASELRMAIWWALKDADITIAFPQIDVHFDAQDESVLRMIRPDREESAPTKKDAAGV